MNFAIGLLASLLMIMLLLMPGLAVLYLSKAWSDWRPLQQISVAFGIGLAIYPVIFYWLRFAFPNFHFQAWMGWGVLFLCSIIGVRQLRRWRLPILRSDIWLITIIVLLVFISRIWIAYQYPYPAWTDSLHHTLLTELFARYGQLPKSLRPYQNVSLTMYHLGLYSLSGILAIMTALPAHTALLWTAQTLNALSVVGVFLLLDRYAGRSAAIVGILIVGLLSHQPAFYVNWGRFTQLSSQTLLPVAWVMSIDVIRNGGKVFSQHKSRCVVQVLMASIASAAVFLYHFRVSVFYLALLLPALAYVFWLSRRIDQFSAVLIITFLIGTIAALAIFPVLYPATKTWLQLNQAAVTTPVVPLEQLKENEVGFYGTSLDDFPLLAARPWLLFLTGICTILGLLARNRVVWMSVIWFILLMVIGHLYLLGIPEISITNLGAILIMLYLPISFSVGGFAQELRHYLPLQWSVGARRYGTLFILILAVPFVWVRAHDVETFRYFVTPADEKAMQWLQSHMLGVSSEIKVAINTTFWLPTSPHGTDAGYWIPYFTGARTNTGVMISSLGGVDMVREIIEDSNLVKRAEFDPAALDALYERGYRFLYIGSKGSFNGEGFNSDFIATSGKAVMIYSQDGVIIFGLHKPS